MSDLTKTMHTAMPLMERLGARLLVNTPEEVRAELDWRPELCTTGGLLHGGAIMALADACGGLCAFLNLPDGAASTSTIESKTNFLRAVRDGHVTATARPLHRGRQVIVIETELRDASGRLVAKVTQTQAVLYPPAA